MTLEPKNKSSTLEPNAMAEILISRYQEFIDNEAVTHLTTNLSASEIEKLYGNRLSSRMRTCLM